MAQSRAHGARNLNRTPLRDVVVRGLEAVAFDPAKCVESTSLLRLAPRTQDVRQRRHAVAVLAQSVEERAGARRHR